MKDAIILAVLLAASSAAAQPAARPCEVTFMLAPDDVRAVIEQWVQAEPRCNVSVELRIIATEGGLYLHARNGHGRVRERVVPDAKSAGVLVASWVAEDSTSQPTPHDVGNPTPPPPAMPEGVSAPAAGTAPGAAPVVDATAIAATPTGTKPARWLSLGGLIAMGSRATTGGGGVRGELELATKGIATFGIAASASETGMEVFGPTFETMGTLDTFDAKLLGTVSVATHRDGWHFAWQLGVGIVYTRALLEQPYFFSSSREAEGVFPTGEATLSVTRELGARWAIAAGPIASLYVQEYEFKNGDAGYYAPTPQARNLELSMFLGLRYRL